MFFEPRGDLRNIESRFDSSQHECFEFCVCCGKLTVMYKKKASSGDCSGAFVSVCKYVETRERFK